VESTIIGVGQDAKAQIVVSWDTDEPSTTQVEYGEGTGSTYSQSTQLDSNLTTNHVVTITGLTPAKIYHLQALSKDKSTNIGKSFDTVIITPSATKAALNLVIENLSKTFGFLKGISFFQ
nr:fibronectin type III domain-containing protein [Candidatus Woesebacteria bacterium]